MINKDGIEQTGDQIKVEVAKLVLSSGESRVPMDYEPQVIDLSQECAYEIASIVEQLRILIKTIKPGCEVQGITILARGRDSFHVNSKLVEPGEGGRILTHAFRLEAKKIT